MMQEHIIKEIKNIESYKLIEGLSCVSVKMFMNNDSIITIPYKINKYQMFPIIMSGWVILNLEYLSIINSNDFRNCKKKFSLERAISLFYQYENLEQGKYLEISNDNNSVFKLLIGSITEQMRYQSVASLINHFNRNYYIFCKTNIFSKIFKMDIDAITKNCLDCNVDEYLKTMIVIFTNSMSNPNLSNFINNSKQPLTRKIIEKYLCTYDDIRGYEFKHLIFYTKPFIKTKRGTILSSSAYTVAMLVSDGIYWFVRDYFYDVYKNDESNKQYFPNKFGYVFEEYIKDLANQYFTAGKWYQIECNTEKQADFFFEFETSCMLIETKSFLLPLSGVQQVPNISKIEAYCQKLRKACRQLDVSYQKMKGNTIKPILKVVLLYDEFVDASISKKVIFDATKEENGYILMTINEFEILMGIYNRGDKTIIDKILGSLLKQINRKEQFISFRQIFTEYGINENKIWINDKDYFRVLLSQITGKEYNYIYNV